MKNKAILFPIIIVPALACIGTPAVMLGLNLKGVAGIDIDVFFEKLDKARSTFLSSNETFDPSDITWVHDGVTQTVAVVENLYEFDNESNDNGTKYRKLRVKSTDTAIYTDIAGGVYTTEYFKKKVKEGDYDKCKFYVTDNEQEMFQIKYHSNKQLYNFECSFNSKGYLTKKVNLDGSKVVTDETFEYKKDASEKTTINLVNTMVGENIWCSSNHILKNNTEYTVNIDATEEKKISRIQVHGVVDDQSGSTAIDISKTKFNSEVKNKEYVEEYDSKYITFDPVTSGTLSFTFSVNETAYNYYFIQIWKYKIY